MWLKDLLPEKLPGAHIMTFAYDAGAVANASPHGVRENAVKLIRVLRDKREDNVSWSRRPALPSVTPSNRATGVGCKPPTPSYRVYWA